MKLKILVANIGILLLPFLSPGQLMQEKSNFKRSDSLRGTITEYRKGWDVIRYDLTIQPNITDKTICGRNTITYREDSVVVVMQIDLQQPLTIDSIISDNNNAYQYYRDNNAYFVKLRNATTRLFTPGIRQLTVYYHGTPKEAKRAPWDGGVVWGKDGDANPWIATACQGLGASAWWPCKDHQSDEPDSGMSIQIIAPDTLTAVSNGRLQKVSDKGSGLKVWTWEVKNPINTYAVTMNIGKYVSWNDTLVGEGGKLDLQYWVLAYNQAKARKQFEQVKPMLRSHEFWLGKYPFYEDSYKLVETPFLGMEHQSATAYGNNFENGYLGKDLSGTGWGLKWDFIIIHESGHEWFGNSITSKDIADMWVHEGFTNYSETLYLESIFGKQAGAEYNYGIRKNIRNDRNIIGYYGVNKEGSADMYYKAANLVNIIRQVINNDSLFRKILRGLNASFYHQAVTTRQVEDYISKESGHDFSSVFDQYLRSTNLPVLEYYYSKNRRKVYYRWANCVASFNLPLIINSVRENPVIYPTVKWNSSEIKHLSITPSAMNSIEKSYYIVVRQVKEGRKGNTPVLN